MPSYSVAARELIRSDALAHLVTINPDGSPQVTCVWVDFDDEHPDDLVFASLGNWQKVKNIRRDPRVTLSIEHDSGPNESGLAPYVVIEGTARITEGGAPALLQRLAHTHISPDTVFPPMPDPPDGFVVHVTANKIAGVGDWTA